MLVNNKINLFNAVNRANNITKSSSQDSSSIRFKSNTEDVFQKQSSDDKSNIINLYSVSFTEEPSLSGYEIQRSEKAASLPHKISDKQVRKLQEKALAKVREGKKFNTAGFSKCNYASAFLTTDDEIITKNNIEASRKFTMCSERSILVESIDNNKPIRAFALSAPDLVRADGGNASICEICLAWYTQFAKTNPEAKNIEVITPEKDPKTQKIVFKVRTLEEHLPQVDYNTPSYVDPDKLEEFLDKAPIVFSDTVDAENKLTRDDIKKLFLKTEQNYEESILINKALGNLVAPGVVAVMTESEDIYTGSTVGPKVRNYTPADLDAIANAVKQEVKKPEISKITSMAVFSKDDPTLPTLENISWLKSPVVRKDLQIAKIENDKIHVYSVKDFQPIEYSSLNNGNNTIKK